MAKKKSPSKAKALTSVNLYLLLISGVFAFEWLRASYGKFVVEPGQPGFIESMPKTLSFFAKDNPYQFYIDFLKNADPSLLGNLTRYSELAVGLALAIAALGLILKLGSRKLMLALGALGALGGMLLNLNFYLAASHTSPSTESVNLVMGLVQLILLGYFLKLSRKS